MTEEVFGWAIRHSIVGVMLPVTSTRVEAIREYVHAIDQDCGSRDYGSALKPHEERAWRRAKRRYGVSAIHVHVTSAFGDRS